MSARPETTATAVNVVLTVEAVCPRCGNTCRVSARLHEESLTTGNTTERAAYVANQLRAEVDCMKALRLWDAHHCGRCRVAIAEGAS